MTLVRCCVVRRVTCVVSGVVAVCVCGGWWRWDGTFLLVFRCRRHKGTTPLDCVAPLFSSIGRTRSSSHTPADTAIPSPDRYQRTASSSSSSSFASSFASVSESVSASTRTTKRNRCGGRWRETSHQAIRQARKDRARSTLLRVEHDVRVNIATESSEAFRLDIGARRQQPGKTPGGTETRRSGRTSSDKVGDKIGDKGGSDSSDKDRATDCNAQGKRKPWRRVSLLKHNSSTCKVPSSHARVVLLWNRCCRVSCTSISTSRTIPARTTIPPHTKAAICLQRSAATISVSSIRVRPNNPGIAKLHHRRRNRRRNHKNNDASLYSLQILPARLDSTELN